MRTARKMTEYNLLVRAVHRSFTDDGIHACVTAMKERMAHCGFRVVRGVLGSRTSGAFLLGQSFYAQC